MITTYTPRDAEACAYLSALVTVEHKWVYLIFKGLAKQPFPAGCLHHLRRMLEEMAGGQVVLEE